MDLNAASSSLVGAVLVFDIILYKEGGISVRNKYR